MMFEFLGGIKDFFAQAFALGSWIMLGALIGFFAALLGMLRSAFGVGMATVGGAVAMFIAIVGGWLGDDSKRVERLERELRWEQAKRAEIEATNAALHKTLKEEADANEFNAVVSANLEAQIDKMEANTQCVVPEELTDELKKLR